VPVLECLIQLFKSVSDDRMSKYVHYLLNSSIGYVEAALREQRDDLILNKLLAFIDILYKQLDWAIGTDPELIQKCVQEKETQVLMKMMEQLFQRLP